MTFICIQISSYKKCSMIDQRIATAASWKIKKKLQKQCVIPIYLYVLVKLTEFTCTITISGQINTLTLSVPDSATQIWGCKSTYGIHTASYIYSHSLVKLFTVIILCQHTRISFFSFHSHKPKLSTAKSLASMHFLKRRTKDLP